MQAENLGSTSVYPMPVPFVSTSDFDDARPDHLLPVDETAHPHRYPSPCKRIPQILEVAAIRQAPWLVWRMQPEDFKLLLCLLVFDTCRHGKARNTAVMRPFLQYKAR